MVIQFTETFETGLQCINHLLAPRINLPFRFHSNDFKAVQTIMAIKRSEGAQCRTDHLWNVSGNVLQLFLVDSVMKANKNSFLFDFLLLNRVFKYYFSTQCIRLRLHKKQLANYYEHNKRGARDNPTSCRFFQFGLRMQGLAFLYWYCVT